MSVMDSLKESGHSTPEMPCIIEPKQYKEMIKTVKAGTHESFDKKVNELLSEGWTVKNAYIFMNGNGNGSTLYCAILSNYYEVESKNGEDVQPVKHGRWIDFPECLKYENAFCDDHIVCSECHHVWNVIDNCTETFKYCPNCGAKMDGDNDGKD